MIYIELAVTRPPKKREKSQEKELRFLRSEFKAVEESTTSLPTIGAILGNTQLRLDVMEDVARRKAQVETGRGVPTEEGSN